MTTTTAKSSDVRQWARSKGIDVGERGRLSPDVLAAYSAAHGGPAVKAPAKKAAVNKAPAKKTAAKKTAAKKTSAKKTPARKAAATKAPATKAPVSAISPAKTTAPVTPPKAVHVPLAPAPSVKPSFRQPETLTGPPAVTLDSERVVALEEQIAKLSARLERLEAARAAAPKRGLFNRK
jgi:hypothetical protein